MKLLLDQGLPRSAGKLLCAAGIDTVHTGDCGLASANDEKILATARSDKRIVVTLDADFHEILALDQSAGPSVIRIRIEGLRGPALTNLLQVILNKCGADLESGAAVTVTEGQIRLRRLPIGDKGN